MAVQRSLGAGGRFRPVRKVVKSLLGERPSPPPPQTLHEFQERLGHQFKDASLLEQALTHSSYAPEKGDDNERLEFLGDRVLGLIIAHTLFARGESLGDMSERFKYIVSRKVCAEIANQLGMQFFLRTSFPGGKQQALSTNVASNVCEALIAAIYLDGGFVKAQSFILEHWHPYLTHIDRPLKDAKSALQEEAQGAHRGAHRTVPEYSLIETTGAAHAAHFRVRVSVKGLGVAEGQGASKREAEHQAAEHLLKAHGLWKIP